MMKSIFTYAAWCAVAGTILYATLNPNGGVLFHGGLSGVGLGLIGLGLWMEARKSFARSHAPVEHRNATKS